MATIFCPSCGSKHDYQFSAPNFCSKCGQPCQGNSRQSKHLLSKSKFAKENPINEVERNDDDESYDEEEDYSNSVRVPRLKNIAVDVELENGENRVVRMQDLADMNGRTSKFPFGKRLSH